MRTVIPMYVGQDHHVDFRRWIDANYSEAIGSIGFYHNGLPLGNVMLLRSCIFTELLLEPKVKHNVRGTVVLCLVADEEAQRWNGRPLVRIGICDEIAFR